MLLFAAHQIEPEAAEAAEDGDEDERTDKRIYPAAKTHAQTSAAAVDAAGPAAAVSNK